MRTVYASEIDAEIVFARKAAAHFGKHPEHTTYTGDDIEPGCFMALRWGLMNDGVLVVKLDENHVPTNYAELVRTEGESA